MSLIVAFSDVMCGRLHCTHENERTEFGYGSVVQSAHSVMSVGRDRYVVCNVAHVDLGGPNDTDPGLVPSGAPCGADKVPISASVGLHSVPAVLL